MDAGIFAGAFMERFPLTPVEDEVRFQNPQVRENLIERVFVYKRWNEFHGSNPKPSDIVSFHTDHKLLVMSRSIKHYRILGNLVANVKDYQTEDILGEYIENLMAGLRLLATVKKNTNVLSHMLGYFRKLISYAEKKELIGEIEDYRNARVPLIVPITRIKHNVCKYNVRYLARRHYLNRDPGKRKIRNYA